MERRKLILLLSTFVLLYIVRSPYQCFCAGVRGKKEKMHVTNQRSTIHAKVCLFLALTLVTQVGGIMSGPTNSRRFVTLLGKTSQPTSYMESIPCTRIREAQKSTLLVRGLSQCQDDPFRILPRSIAPAFHLSSTNKVIIYHLILSKTIHAYEINEYPS